MTTYTALLDFCELALNDVSNSTWLRSTLGQWADEAMRALPILRPMRNSYAVVSPLNKLDMPSDFREMVSVEYPLNEDPPSYLIRMNRLDPDF